MNIVHPRIDQLDLNLFRVFDVVYRERHLGRAAATLSVTQSAVSHALARLRDQLGDPLFVRRGRTLVPTSLATELAPPVRESLGGLQRALHGRHDFDPRRDLARVTIGLPAEVEPILLPELFARLQKVAPQVTLTLALLDRTRLRAELSAGRFDVAIDVARSVDAEVVHERLMEDPFCVVAARGRRRLDRAAYLGAGHVVVSSRRSGPTLEDTQMGPEGVQRRVAVRCQRYEAACLVVASSSLLLTLPRSQAELRRRLLPLKLFDPPVRIPPVQLHLYWLRESSETPANRWIRDTLGRLFR